MPEPFLTDYDLHLLFEGRHFKAYEKLGAHVGQLDGVDGVHFAVVAPNASGVSVVSDFNGWSAGSDPMRRLDHSGVSDGAVYGGSGGGNLGAVRADPVPIHGRHHSLDLTLPPLSMLVFARTGASR